MKVLTYNVGLHFPGYGDLIRADKIRMKFIDGDWDIIFLNEVYHQSLTKVLLNDKNLEEKYPHRVYNLSRYGRLPFLSMNNGLAILSKYPIKRYLRYEYKNSHNNIANKLVSKKDALFAEISVNGTSVGICTTHLQWGKYESFEKFRHLHMTELREFIETQWSFDKPLIIAGDLNIFGDVTDVDYQHFVKTFPELVDWYGSTNDLETSPGYTWDRNNTKILLLFLDGRFDYIFSTPDLKPVSTQIHKFKAVLNWQRPKWEPTNKFTFLELSWFIFARLGRLVLSPLILVFLLFINTFRLIKSVNLIVFLAKRDLSDHYALEGVCEFDG